MLPLLCVNESQWYQFVKAISLCKCLVVVLTKGKLAIVIFEFLILWFVGGGLVCGGVLQLEKVEANIITKWLVAFVFFYFGVWFKLYMFDDYIIKKTYDT